MKQKKILIANKYFLMNYAIKCIFQRIKDFEVIGVAEDEVEQKIEELNPELLVVEIDLLKMNSFQLLTNLKSQFPQLKIIVLLDVESKPKLMQILQYKLDGYLLKNTTKEELISAAQTVFKGESYYSSSINKIMLDDIVTSHPPEINENVTELSMREKEVLTLIAAGRNNEEIAELLFISSNTVLTHRRNIMRKLNVNSTPQLILTGVRRGIISIN
jgi:DNA-binding NarL/FixJ family response regulator